MELRAMADTGKHGSGGKPPRSTMRPATKSPEWADGLRKLYDSVVEEPLPDSFDDLLKKLDQANHD
jgi:Anti-sigma factor NepR